MLNLLIGGLFALCRGSTGQCVLGRTLLALRRDAGWENREYDGANGQKRLRAATRVRKLEKWHNQLVA